MHTESNYSALYMILPREMCVYVYLAVKQCLNIRYVYTHRHIRSRNIIIIIRSSVAYFASEPFPRRVARARHLAERTLGTATRDTGPRAKNNGT